MSTVDTILADCHALKARFANLGHPLVAFECGTDAVMAIARAAAPMAVRGASDGDTVPLRLEGVEIRHVVHLRRDVVVPVYRLADGEETWGKPIYLKVAS